MYYTVSLRVDRRGQHSMAYEYTRVTVHAASGDGAALLAMAAYQADHDGVFNVRALAVNPADQADIDALAPVPTPATPVAQVAPEAPPALVEPVSTAKKPLAGSESEGK